VDLFFAEFGMVSFSLKGMNRMPGTIFLSVSVPVVANVTVHPFFSAHAFSSPKS